MWMQQILGEMLRGPSSPKSQDTHLSLINPHYYQTKDSSVQLLNRISGSLALLNQASGIMNKIASCPVLKRDGSPCGCRLNQDGEFTHFIGCKSHGFHLRPHNCMEDTLLATFQDALRRRIIGTDAFT